MFLAAGSASAAGAFKIGAGMFFDNNTPGAHLSIDIPVGEGSFAISPFADIFHKSEQKIYGGGLNFLIKRPVGESSQWYAGVGGGFASVKTLNGSSSGAMADVVVGLEFGVSEKAAIFSQGKWIGTFGGSSVRNFALQAGVSFGFGE